jgi:hypothetical protein
MIGEGIVGSGMGEVRSYCGVGFSARGYRALVVDRRRKLLVVSLPLKEGDCVDAPLSSLSCSGRVGFTCCGEMHIG